MSFQTPTTIAEVIDNIQDSRYLLPAIQREFEWRPSKIEWLFDSLMRGYPISSFLFWNVEGDTVSGYKFYQFLRDYRERFNIHNEDANVEGVGSFTAILDGQQRLTSLYVGLRGSYAYKEKHRRWVDDEWSIPTRNLYLNISRTLDDEAEEDGRVYEFSFLKESLTKRVDFYDQEWFRVGKIWDLRNFATFSKYISQHELDELAVEILARLQEIIFTERTINFFLERKQDLHKALNIFIRINSGGMPLNFSDLIMSIAIANWKNRDARKEIHTLVDRIQSIGFTISKDFIFKTFLYLYSADIRFKVTNFTVDSAQSFEENWEDIRDAIQLTFEVIRSFGYTDFTLTSKNAVIPIIYYVYHQKIFRNFESGTAYREDRDIVKKWLHVMTLKRVFGGQSDGTLAQIRRAFTENVTSEVKIKSGINNFPALQMSSQIKRDLSVGDEYIEELLLIQKDDRYAFSVLALLYPQLDYCNNDFHKDHLHPKSSFRANMIDSLELEEDERATFDSSEWNNSIVNLQMLNSNENMSKQDKSLVEWFVSETESKNSDSLRERCIIPADVSLEFKDFKEFATKRKALLATKLKAILG